MELKRKIQIQQIPHLYLNIPQIFLLFSEQNISERPQKMFHKVVLIIKGNMKFALSFTSISLVSPSLPNTSFIKNY